MFIAIARFSWLATLLSLAALASGPADRKPTDPQAVSSEKQPPADPIKVEDLLQITRTADTALSPDGTHIAFISNASGRLNLWLMNVDGTGAHQLLQSNDRQSGPVFSHTGDEIIYPHGGPTGQTIDSFSNRAILLASRGFVVIAPNVRGSTGYGMEFQKANYKDLGGADLKDEIAGVDFLKSTGFIDPKKVGIWGGSYGGFMTLMAIGKTPDIWSAAVDEYGILNWYTMLQHEDPRLQEYEKSILGDPEKDRQAYENSSPLKYIRNEHAPLLVLQGERDIRVPKEEAEQVVAILKAEGRTVEAVYYPEEGHGFMKREHQIDELTRAAAWFQAHLQ